MTSKKTLTEDIEYMFSKKAGILCHRLTKNMITYQDDYSWHRGDYGTGLFFFIGYRWEHINQWEVINGDWIFGRREDGTFGSTRHPEAHPIDISDAILFHQSDIEDVLGLSNYSTSKEPIIGAEKYVDTNLKYYQVMYTLAEEYAEKCRLYRFLRRSIPLELAPPDEPTRDRSVAF